MFGADDAEGRHAEGRPLIRAAVPCRERDPAPRERSAAVRALSAGERTSDARDVAGSLGATTPVRPRPPAVSDPAGEDQDFTATATPTLVLASDYATLAQAIDMAAAALPSRAATAAQHQVLTGLLLAAGDDGMVAVTAFDYEVATTVRDVAVAAAPGRVLVPGLALRDIVKGAGKSHTARQRDRLPIVMHGADTVWTVECAGTQTTLRTLPDDEYPSVPPLPALIGHVDGAAFAAAVGQVISAAGRDDTLPVLTAVRIEWDRDTLTLAATDRYRLAVRTVAWRPADPAATGTLLIPARTLATVAKDLCGHGELAMACGPGPSGEALAGFAAGTIRTTARLVEGQFPPYRKLLPDRSPHTAHLDRATVADAVRRVALVAPKKAPVRLTFTAGQLRLDAGSYGAEARASESVPADYTGPDLECAYNPAYLADAFAAITTDRITFGFASDSDMQVAATKPCVLSGPGEPDYRYLIMPIQING